MSDSFKDNNYHSGVFNCPECLRLQSGHFLPSIKIAYNTYGNLNAARSNAILVCHALTSDQHVCNAHPITGKAGWWHRVVGSGKAIDTDSYFVICANVLGGCMGTTGPASERPDDKEDDKKPDREPKESSKEPPKEIPKEPPKEPRKEIYGLSFPLVTITDMVEAQRHLIEHLGIERLLCVIGGSMGGMQALQWAAAYPDLVCSAVVIASASRHSPQNIALHEVGRQAIMADYNWHSGRYYQHDCTPKKGLAVARMAAHVTYLSENALQSKFGRSLQNHKGLSYGFAADFQIESYLRHQGMSFVDRFDANSYLYLTRAMDYFDLCKDFDCTLQDLFGRSKVQFCLISFSSDWLFPTRMSREIANALAFNGARVSFVEIDTDKGHDSFLLDEPEMFSIISGFISSCERMNDRAEHDDYKR